MFLEHVNLTVTEPLYEPGRRLYVFDPDGVEIELVEYPA